MELDWFLEVYKIEPDGRIFNTRSGREVTQYPKSHGYLEVVLCREGKRKYCLVHRLVGLSFVGNPQELPDINHIDGNRHNNHYSNLEWVTKKENNRKRLLNKLTYDAVKEIKHLYCVEGLTQKEIADRFSVHQAHISRVLRSERW